MVSAALSPHSLPEPLEDENPYGPIGDTRQDRSMRIRANEPRSFGGVVLAGIPLPELSGVGSRV